MRSLCEKLGEDAVFVGAPERQVGEMHFRTGAGASRPSPT
ncbi:hypothetical protein [Kutzneria kofuensis]